MLNTIFIRLCLTGAGIISLPACMSTRNVAYFKDIPAVATNWHVDFCAYEPPPVQTGDVLQVSVRTLEPGMSAGLNHQAVAMWPAAETGGGHVPAGSSLTGTSGHPVDRDGNIILPLIGKIKVSGMSAADIQETIREKSAKYYKDPIVHVGFANFKITVLGEVNRPATYIMPDERVTVLDALGAAGDLTVYGKRENVLLIRSDINGSKQLTRINLNSSKLFRSSAYYLRQGDVLYVEPDKSKIITTDAGRMRNITIITSVLTVLTVLLTRIR